MNIETSHMTKKELQYGSVKLYIVSAVLNFSSYEDSILAVRFFYRNNSAHMPVWSLLTKVITQAEW